MRLRRNRPVPEPEPEAEPASYPVAHRVYYKQFDDPEPGTEHMREFTPQELGEAEWEFVKAVRSCRYGMYGARRTTVWSSGNES